MGLKLEINYPENLPDVLQESKEQFEHEARMAMAVKLYEMKRISSGIAAKLAGISRVDFLMELHKYGVPVIDYDEEELETDILNA